MTIQIGSRLPEATLRESTAFGDVCPVAPKPIELALAVNGKQIVMFGVPGAFTPTCSEKHVPGYREHAAEFRAKGVDEIWCVAVNDAYVMAAWGRSEGALGEIRFSAMARASSPRTRARARPQCHRHGRPHETLSMLIEDGVVKVLDVEASGKFEVSNAETMLKQLG